MIIKEISSIEFDLFASSHMLGSFYQSSSYGKLMDKNGYKSIYIGAFKDEKLVAASLILSKTISLNVKYGYAPRGFLIDYLDTSLFIEFTDCIKKYFGKKGFAFIKINPIITYSEINLLDNSKNINNLTSSILDTLENNNYKKLKDNVYFESVLPKYNPIVNLKLFDFGNLNKKLQDKLNKIGSKGLNMIKGDIYNVNVFYELIKGKTSTDSTFYKEMYKIFSENNMIDLYLIEVNYHTYLENLQVDYSTEKTINEKINNIFQLAPTDKNIYREKMDSDNKLHSINMEISDINNKIQSGIYKEIVAGALVINYGNSAYIYESGFNKKYNRILPNHYLHYMLLSTYKKMGKSFMDLNGITGDFSKDNPYKGLNDFKLGWNPKVYEYLGEFDLIIKDTKYALLWSTKTLHKEFEKKGLKNTD